MTINEITLEELKNKLAEAGIENLDGEKNWLIAEVKNRIDAEAKKTGLNLNENLFLTEFVEISGWENKIRGCCEAKKGDIKTKRQNFILGFANKVINYLNGVIEASIEEPEIEEISDEEMGGPLPPKAPATPIAKIVPAFSFLFKSYQMYGAEAPELTNFDRHFRPITFTVWENAEGQMISNGFELDDLDNGFPLYITFTGLKENQAKWDQIGLPNEHDRASDSTGRRLGRRLNPHLVSWEIEIKNLNWELVRAEYDKEKEFWSLTIPGEAYEQVIGKQNYFQEQVQHDIEKYLAENDLTPEWLMGQTELFKGVSWKEGFYKLRYEIPNYDVALMYNTC